MNLKDLIAKMTAIEEGVQPVEECGAMPVHAGPGQQDNVTMNVSMNGQGEGGIRNLMDILRNLDKAEHGHEEPIMGDIVAKMTAAQEGPEIEMGEELGDDGETYGNSAHGDAGSHVHGIDAVTATGNDLASKGKASPLATAPGTNPLRGPVQEGLVDKLQAHYEEIKMREGVFSNIGQAVGNVAQGVSNAVNDVQQGYQQATTPPRGAPATAAPAAQPAAKPAAKPAVNPEMVKIAQQLAAGTIPQDQAMAQLMKLAGQTAPAAPAAPAPARSATTYKNVSGMSDKDW